MKKYTGIVLAVLTVGCLIPSPCIVKADDANGINAGGSVKVEDSGKTTLVDPEFPGTIIDPGPGPSTSGNLRFDFASLMDFHKEKITDKGRKYNVLAQNFKNEEVGPRGNYVQITDVRKGFTGWTLQVKQEIQFVNADGKELTGAVLSLDKGWANSSGSSEAPTVTRNTIEINNLGQAYEVAKAEKGTGSGVWTIEFGASADNNSDQDVTLKKVVDDKGEPIVDPVFKKTKYSNNAITLTIPDSTKIYPTEYGTKITWILGELP